MMEWQLASLNRFFTGQNGSNSARLLASMLTCTVWGYLGYLAAPTPIKAIQSKNCAI